MREQKNKLRIIILVVIVASLSLIGVVYGGWDDKLNISGQFTTGGLSMNVEQNKLEDSRKITSQTINSFTNCIGTSTTPESIQSLITTTNSAITASAINVPLTITNEGKIATILQDNVQLVLEYIDNNFETKNIVFNSNVYCFNNNNIYLANESYENSLDIFQNEFINAINDVKIHTAQIRSLTIKLILTFKPFNSNDTSKWYKTNEIILFKNN